MEHRREHQHHLRPLQGLGIGGLGANQVHFGVGQGAVIADRAGQHKGHAPPHAGVEDALVEHALLDGRRQAAAAANCVDRFEVVAVAAMDRQPLLQIHPQGGAHQGLLHIMDGDGIAAQQGLHVTLAHQLGQVGAAAGVDHHGAGHHHHLAAPIPDAAPLPGHLLHHQLHPPLARHPRRHEAEIRLPRFSALPRRLRPQGAQALHAHHHLLSGPQIPQQAALHPGQRG